MLEISKKQPKYDEQYPLRLILHECKKHKLDFLIGVGIRKLLYNGDFFGITSTKHWNIKVEAPLLIEQAKQHYRIELRDVLTKGTKYIIRNKDFADNPFLLKLADAELCNGLGVYTKSYTGVSPYFFTARHDDKEAIHFFVNHLNLFQSIVDDVDGKLTRSGFWNHVSIPKESKNLFNANERRLIFNDKIPCYSPRKVLWDGKEVGLTRREMQLLDTLADTNSVKELAKALNIEMKTTESHLYKIRKKLGIHSRSKLIEFASTI